MNTRNAMVLVVMVVVLGGGLVALQLASRPRSPEPPAAEPPSPLVAPAPAPAPVPRPPRARPAAMASDAESTIDGRVLDGMTHEGVANAELTFVGDAGVSTFRTSSDGTFELTPAATGSL